MDHINGLSKDEMSSLELQAKVDMMMRNQLGQVGKLHIIMVYDGESFPLETKFYGAESLASGFNHNTMAYISRYFTGIIRAKITDKLLKESKEE